MSIKRCLFTLVSVAALSHLATADHDDYGDDYGDDCEGDDLPVTSTTVCNGQTYVYNELAGFGFVANDARDKVGDTIGGIGSAIAIDRKSWRLHRNGSYTGLLYGLPDRGWNTEGTLNVQNRIHKFQITFTPDEDATVANPSPPNLLFRYLDSIFLTDPAGTPTTGLDADVRGPYLSFSGLGASDVPSAHYTGDGFGNAGPGGNRVTVDSEGLFLGHDGTFWISDEYGPYIYHFSANGSMIGAIRPPDALIPNRNGSESFSANSPPRYNPNLAPVPGDPKSGRSNNQGFEGLTVSPDGRTLYAMLQSAIIQEGGSKNPTSGNTRFLSYDISSHPPKYLAEYIVPQSHVVPNDTTTKIARESEIHYVSPTQFLILARDSNAGRGQGNSTTSIYRHIDVFDISKATNIKGASADSTNGSVASSTGVLNKGTSNITVTPAQYCSWLDFNLNSQLNRFGVRNGGAQSNGLLNEKWESIGILPVNPDDDEVNEYFIISMSDNDFITQHGYVNFGKMPYADSSGYSLDNQALVFRVTLPEDSQPLVS
ncbi:hypothetical protein AMS68_001206 [Peltaster fructicola]|uniref:Phytase-like domain-containing protein n=1 Tax=Peltaster fructicola TaxID=286661 RepID=A0A6H0XM36_9PEZI|nr:hypothetical protein AMS68_001206 [Peltaster fructicola]